MQLCLRFTKNERDALEVLNNGFLKVFQNIHRYDAAKASLYTWIRTIVINSCIDFIKQKREWEVHNELYNATEVNIEPEAVSKLKAAQLLHLIRQLPPATAAVFNLYAIEGYTHKEVAQL